MLDISIRVTKSSTHLEQIHHIGILNVGKFKEDGFFWYKVFLDGIFQDTLLHKRSDGALALLKDALELINDEGLINE